MTVLHFAGKQVAEKRIIMCCLTYGLHNAGYYSLLNCIETICIAETLYKYMELS